MSSRSLGGRLGRQAAGAAVLLAAFGVGTAQADITGSVVTPAGTPVPGVTVEAIGANGAPIAGAADNTNASGAYIITTATLAAGPGPYTLTTSTLTCRKDEGGEPATATTAPTADGVPVNLTLDTFLVCAALEPVGTAPTGYVSADESRFLGTPGAKFALDVLVPQEASDFKITDAKGAVLGSGTSRLGLRFRAPSKPFRGPLTLNWVEAGLPGGRPLGSLAVAKAVKPKPSRGAVDQALIMDAAGVLGGRANAPQRAAAAGVFIDEAGRGDRLFATTFASGATGLFPRTTVTGTASRSRLKGLAAKEFVAEGGTDYDAGFASTFNAVSASPKRARPKSAVFIATSEHDDGEYNNTHLRFAFNGTARSWPVCVVQVGGLSPAGTATLKRIARDTTGTYRRVSGVGGLNNAVARCNA